MNHVPVLQCWCLNFPISAAFFTGGRAWERTIELNWMHPTRSSSATTALESQKYFREPLENFQRVSELFLNFLVKFLHWNKHARFEIKRSFLKLIIFPQLHAHQSNKGVK
jgi:hypothetical protein